MEQIIEIVKTKYDNVVVYEDIDNFYVDLRTGSGEVMYPKHYYNVHEIINDIMD